MKTQENQGKNNGNTGLFADIFLGCNCFLLIVLRLFNYKFPVLGRKYRAKKRISSCNIEKMPTFAALIFPKVHNFYEKKA
ncbi:MAG: hypothetical protein LBO71_06620 [Prevotellaceae bacterium]|jgi:hypothetical protein|nr:hypothetical protein [Prevotellaceae bacterium]